MRERLIANIIATKTTTKIKTIALFFIPFPIQIIIYLFSNIAKMN